jgi:hypothetical protein
METKASLSLKALQQQIQETNARNIENEKAAKAKGIRNLGIEELKALPTLSASEDIQELLFLVNDKSKSNELRTLALGKTGTAVLQDQRIFERLLVILQDGTEAPAFRFEVLDFIKSSNFLESKFNKYLPMYLNVLRKLTEDSLPEIRDEVMEILAKKKDEYVQRKILEGLNNPDKALVPQERAVQLLGYDLHADQYPLLRKIIQDSKNAQARLEAVRILALDPKSEELLYKLLLNKNELKDIRSFSALAVHKFAPDKFKKFALEAILDSKEYEDLKSLILVSIHQDSQIPNNSLGELFNNAVKGFRTNPASEELRKAAAAFEDRKQ